MDAIYLLAPSCWIFNGDGRLLEIIAQKFCILRTNYIYVYLIRTKYTYII